MIKKSTIHDTEDNGGRGLMDLHERNKSIDIGWAKRYLTSAGEAPTWTHALEAICKAKLVSGDAKKCDDASLVNHMTQDLEISSRSLPHTAKRIMKAIKKNNIRFDPVNPTTELKEGMPFWHHLFVPKKTRPRYNTARCKCLRENHAVRTVSDAIRVAEDITHHDGHSGTHACKCTACGDARAIGCQSPQGCAGAALKILEKIPAKWDPRIHFKADYELTDREKEKNKQAKTEGGAVIFDPQLKQESTLQECFRIFGYKNSQDVPPRADNPLADPDTEYTVTHLSEASKADARTGRTTALGHHENPRTRTAGRREKLRTTRLTEGAALLTAMLEVVRGAEDEENIELVIPRRGVMDALTTKLQKHEDNGWVDYPNRQLMMTLTAKMRNRPGRTAIRMPEGAEQGHKGASTLAREAAEMDTCTHRNMTSDPGEVRGASLATISQREVYATLMEAKKPDVRKQTRPNLEKVRKAIKTTRRGNVTDRQIWLSLRSKDMRRNVRQFMYKSMHDAHRCGRHWKDIPECGDRVFCKHCSADGQDIEESIEHILTECTAPGRQAIWDEAKSLCEARNIPWSKPSMGAVLGNALMRFKDAEGKSRLGDNRFYRILISEGAYMVWLVRNERVVQNENDKTKYAAPAALKERLRAQLRRRHTIDKTMTDKRQFGVKAILQATVDDTWHHTDLERTAHPPNDVPQQARVLSGLLD
ncbi:hypothetical protein BD626DRAFT_451541 [Schizophyllum amplum]|uniref:Reverse transcriptase zinc-binding domain-containing protein n=1 Tax=Schizophyllum amplum TaxID=97359 RepID=A0A550CP36_9AGAR|nr:hypothetical protein BD626DRAFT_451541 [Auriculariopsis ampla]